MRLYLSKKNYRLGECVEGEVTDIDTNNSIKVIKITKHYDYLIYTEIQPVDNRFSINLNDAGLYICRGCEDNTDMKTFSYGMDEEIDPDNAIVNIYREREKSVSRKKHADEGGNKHFDVYMFCENINPISSCDYDDVRIIPYNHYNQMGEFDLINRFMEEYNISKAKLSESDYTHRYSAVLIMENIVALDYNSAGKYATDRMGVLLNLYAVQDMCNPRIIASVVMDRTTKELYRLMYAQKYLGNLLQIGDYGEGILRRYQICVHDKQLIFLLSLARDAYSEPMADIKTYRLWLVLEYIAFVFDIDDGEREKIRRLVKEKDPEYNEDTVCCGLDIESFLDVCLQRRNCCTHQGGCIVDSDGKCNTHLTRREDCRKKCSQFPVHGTYFMNDEICVKLEWLVKRLIFCCIDYRNIGA